MLIFPSLSKNSVPLRNSTISNSENAYRRIDISRIGDALQLRVFAWGFPPKFRRYFRWAHSVCVALYSYDTTHSIRQQVGIEWPIKNVPGYQDRFLSSFIL